MLMKHIVKCVRKLRCIYIYMGECYNPKITFLFINFDIGGQCIKAESIFKVIKYIFYRTIGCLFIGLIFCQFQAAECL